MSKRVKLIDKFKDKTIYFLGAGFPMDAGAPSQDQLMQRLRDFDPVYYAADHTYWNDDIESILEAKSTRVREFIDSLLMLNYDADLEDIYTPIDRCIMDNRSFRQFSAHQLVEIREDLNSLIAFIIDRSFRDPGVEPQYIDRFANYIVESNRSYAREKSVIFTTNWDIALDHKIHHASNDSPRDYNVVDYCCHYTHFEEGPAVIPGLVAHARRVPTNKMLKLHGSYNWLTCSNCGKVQVGMDEKIVLRQYAGNTSCGFCDSQHLQSTVLMPTFLKTNRAPQLRNVWEQAGVELSEAHKIVFLGYSFPMADFEIKQLLSRFVSPETEIEVVLTSSSDSAYYDSLNDEDEAKLEKIKTKTIHPNLPTTRYQRFFARNPIRFHYDGVQAYVNRLAQ